MGMGSSIINVGVIEMVRFLHNFFFCFQQTVFSTGEFNNDRQVQNSCPGH